MFQNIENVTYAEEAYFKNYKLFQKKYLYYIFASSLMSSRKIQSPKFLEP